MITLPTWRSFFNSLLKGMLMFMFFFVGYMYGVNNSHQEIMDNQSRIAYLEKMTLSQQKEIDLLKNHSLEAEYIKATIENLTKRITALEALIKSKEIK